MRNEQSILSDVFPQPWFLPLRTAFAIRALIPAEHRHKVRAYFDAYGCLKCEKKNAKYGSNAMCKICIQQVKLRMLFAVKRRWTEQIRRHNLPELPETGGSS
jgi:hypothetical protein